MNIPSNDASQNNNKKEDYRPSPMPPMSPYE